MEWFWPEGALTLVMIGTFVFGAFALNLPIAVAMSLARKHTQAATANSRVRRPAETRHALKRPRLAASSPPRLRQRLVTADGILPTRRLLA